MGAVLSATYARRAIMVSSRYLRLKRYSNSARYRGTCFSRTALLIPHQGRFDVSKSGVDPLEGRLPGRFCTAAGYDFRMRASRPGNRGEAGKPIGDNLSIWGKRFAGKLADRLLAKARQRGAEEFDRACRLPLRPRRQRRAFFRRRRGPVCRDAGRQIGVVHLYCAFQKLCAIALKHDLGKLVFHNPGGCLGNASRRPSSILDIPFFDWVR